VRPQGRDWTPLIVLAVAVSVALTGAGFLGGYAVGYAQHKPVADRANPSTRSSATASAAPANPTDVLPQCSFSDFPVYPASVKSTAYAPGGTAWWVDQNPTRVASYFDRGAYQTTWTFVAVPSVGQWFFRFTRAPACRGLLRVIGGENNGTHYEVNTDAP
jgi:hypothetical protein